VNRESRVHRKAGVDRKPALAEEHWPGGQARRDA
jgi:hypothetical protein